MEGEFENLHTNIAFILKSHSLNLWSHKSKIVVTCSNRIAPFLLKEVNGIGYTKTEMFKTGVVLDGTMEDCIRLNLRLFTAGQVLFSLKRFRAINADELYETLVQLPWEEIIPLDGYFSITSNVRTEAINNNLFANVKVKDAIADRFRKVAGERPDSGAALDGVVINLYWREEWAEVFLDTSGQTLSKHGYRRIPGKAPMIEALAAATIIASQWDKEHVFVNPMCGSGTLAIEAALMATKRTPALYRSNYAFMHVKNYKAGFYEKEMEEIRKGVKNHLPLRIIASDLSQDAVNITKINAEVAGVKHLIDVELCDYAQTTVPESANGVVFFNPEYGDRLGTEKALEEIYAGMGDFMKQRCKGYKGYIFTGNLNLAKKVGLKASRRIEFFNGKIDCRLLEYELYAGSREK